MAVVVVAVIWLAVSNQLALYIHPRYVAFSVIMAMLALLFVVASTVFTIEPLDDDPPRSWRRFGNWVATASVVLVAVSMLVLPPTTLSSATAAQREINSTALAGVDVDGEVPASTDSTAGFTVRDWAVLLRQTSDRAFYAGKQADVVGFVAPSEDDPENTFYVTRFVITHCAVDAQPVGVLVYQPDWQDQFSTDDWVEAVGSFDTNPSPSSGETLALLPEVITTIEQPSDPYIY